MKNFTIELGGQEYSVKPLPIRPARELRKEIGTALDIPLKAFRGIQGIELTDTDALADIVIAMKGVLFESIDIALKTIYGYSPEIKADKDRIEESATDDEVVAAIVEVVKRLFPFGALTSLLSKATTGLMGQQTSKN